MRFSAPSSRPHGGIRRQVHAHGFPANRRGQDPLLCGSHGPEQHWLSPRPITASVPPPPGFYFFNAVFAQQPHPSTSGVSCAQALLRAL